MVWYLDHSILTRFCETERHIKTKYCVSFYRKTCYLLIFIDVLFDKTNPVVSHWNQLGTMKTRQREDALHTYRPVGKVLFYTDKAGVYAEGTK